MSRRTNDAARAAVHAAFRVHVTLGPGLFESVYEECLTAELDAAGVPFDRQVGLPVVYRGNKLPIGFRLDLVVDRRVVVELKCVDRLTPVHKAQLITYLRLSGLPLGLLINFNVETIREGIRRVIA